MADPHLHQGADHDKTVEYTHTYIHMIYMMYIWI